MFGEENPRFLAHNATRVVARLSTEMQGIEMAIDITREKLRTFAVAARALPRRRRQKPVSPSTLWRWHRYGVKHGDCRIYLEAIRTPSGTATTFEALQRFLNRLSDSDRELYTNPVVQPCVGLQKALKQLDSDGVRG